jgi:hypothetical protein
MLRASGISNAGLGLLCGNGAAAFRLLAVLPLCRVMIKNVSECEKFFEF